jgi:hypothetical protein
MDTKESSLPRKSPAAVRRDGWTAARQLAFLETLARTRSVSRAAARAGMSRESAYRLRARPAGALFAAAWDRTLARKSQNRPSPAASGHADRSEKGANSTKVTKVIKFTTPGLHARPGGVA